MPTVSKQVVEDVEIEIGVYCAGCGSGLCGETDTREGTRRGEDYRFDVQPCRKCIEAAVDAALAEQSE